MPKKTVTHGLVLTVIERKWSVMTETAQGLTVFFILFYLKKQIYVYILYKWNVFQVVFVHVICYGYMFLDKS